MIALPASVLAALAFVGAALAAFVLAWRMASPVIRATLKQRISEADRAKLHAAVKGAFDVVSAGAKLTPGRDVLDGLAEALDIVAADIYATLGRSLTSGEREQARLQLLARHASETVPGVLGRGDASAALKRDPLSSR